MATAIDGNKLVEMYISLRDKRSELKAKFEEEDEKLSSDMEAISTVLEGLVMANGTASSVRFEAGTVTRKVTTNYSAPDWDAFKTWAKDNNRLDMLQNRINNSAVTDYMTVTNALPPGVFANSKYTISVRRS